MPEPPPPAGKIEPRAQPPVAAFALLGAGAGLAAGMGLARAYSARLVYRGFDGIIGSPAFLDYSPGAKIAGYVLAAGCALAGMIAAGLWARPRPGLAARSAAAAIAAAVGILCPALALFLGWAPPSISETLRELVRSPRALFELLAGAGALAFLAYPAFAAKKAGEEAPNAESLKRPLMFAEFCLLYFVCWLLLQPGKSGATGAIVAAIFGIFIWLWVNRPSRSGSRMPPLARLIPPDGARHFELVACSVFAVAPLGIIGARVWRTLDGAAAPGGDFLSWSSAVVVVAGCAALLRWQTGAERMFSPLALIPFSAAALYLGAGGPVVPGVAYDPYHQGEHVYAARATAEGLLPFRDIFFVHGLGFNWLPGWIPGRALDTAPGLDLFVISTMSAAGIALMAWLYLRLWGAAWWLMALAFAATTAGGVNRCARYLPIYIAAHLALTYLRGRGAAWLAAAGFVSAAAVFFSADIGAVALAGGAAWAAAHGLASARGWEKLKPAALFLSGAALAGAIASALLAAAGLLGDFARLHLDYFAMKPHYDNLPFAHAGVVYWMAPAVSVLAAGAWTLAHFRRAEQDAPEGPLWSAALLFALMSFVAYLRGLDRSDEGHIYYSSMLAWPALGCLIALAGRRVSPWRALAHSALAAALLLAIPRASAPVGGREPMLVDGIQMVKWYRAHSAMPIASRKEEMDQGFFDLCRALEGEIKRGDAMLDLTNQPAIYRFVPSLRCPTRFYSAFYPSSAKWQDEVVASAERGPAPWALWPGEKQPYLRVDGIDQRVRLWKIAAHVRRRYHPAKRMPDGSLLLARGAEDGAASAIDWPEAPEGPVELGKVPLVWGRAGSGAPPPPPAETVLAETAEGAAGTIPLSADQAAALARADEIWVESRHANPPAPADAAPVSLSLRLAGADGAASAEVSFAFLPGSAGLYRVPLGGLRRWGAPPDAALEWKLSAPAGLAGLNLRISARGAGHN